jgi:oligopeptide/dipeptide ABC transporter ATP-binding protein
VLVAYAGRIVEQASVTRLFDRPLHPYTRALLSCVPTLAQDQDRLAAIPGNLPEPPRRPSGCRFSDRCDHALPPCSLTIPPLESFEPDHQAACIRVRDIT